MISARKSLAELSHYQLPTLPRENKIRLDLNESRWGCSPKAIAAIKNIEPENISVYPEYDELIGKIAAYYRVNSQNVMVTNGGDDAIRCIMATYIEKNNEVIVPVPTFSEFEIHAELNEAKIIKVVYNKDFSFPLDNLLKSITKNTKLIVIINPHNPTGTSLEKENLIKILQKGSNSIVLLDEAYYHFMEISYVELINDFDNLIVMHSFSKAFGLAGLRLGCIFSNCKNIADLSKVNLPYPVNSLAVVAACSALDDRHYMNKVIKEMKREKEFLYKKLKELSLEVHFTDTNFLLVNFHELSDIIHSKLIDLGILVKNLKYQTLLNGYLRITIGTHNENLVLLKALKKIIQANTY